jgi:hypothetical protein
MYSASDENFASGNLSFKQTHYHVKRFIINININIIIIIIIIIVILFIVLNFERELILDLLF